MDLLKKHYEKIILSLVLVGVVVASALLPGRISREQEELENQRKGIIKTKPKELQPVDLAVHAEALKKMKTPAAIVLSGPHNLFNPVQWLQRADRRVIKAADANAIVKDFVITRISPLKYTVSFEGPSGSGDSLRYKIGLTDQAAPTPGGRRKIIRTMRVGERNDLFILQSIKGAADSPAELKVEILKDKEQVVLPRTAEGKMQEYERIAGYEADGKYDPEQKKFTGLRVGSEILFANEIYKIIAITEHEVLLSNKTTGARTPIKFAQP